MSSSSAPLSRAQGCHVALLWANDPNFYYVRGYRPICCEVDVVIPRAMTAKLAKGDGVRPMPKLTEEEANALPEPSPMQVVGGYVRRYWDMVAIANRKPVRVIGENGIIRDKPGFEVDFITRASLAEN